MYMFVYWQFAGKLGPLRHFLQPADQNSDKPIQ